MALDVDLGKMVGPLPLGAWLAVVGGSLGFMVYNRRTAETEAYAEPDTSAPESISGTGNDPAVGTGGWTYTPPQSSDTSLETVTTNEEWSRNAVNALIGMKYNPALADSAMRKYMDGEKLSASEYSLVSIALGNMGAPPTLLPAPLFAPPTAPKLPTSPTAPTKAKPTAAPKPKPVSKPHIRYYVVKPGDTLSRIGKKIPGVGWQAIYNANRKGKRRADGTPGMISNPNFIRPGWRLIIPN